MKRNHRYWLPVLLLAMCAPAAIAESCWSAAEMEPAVRSTIENAGRQYYSMSARGDVAGLRSSAMPALLSDFAGVESAVVQNKENLAGAQAIVRASYLLEAEGNAPLAQAEFYCGIFNSPDRVGFVINNLPPGKYAIVIMDAKGGKAPATLSLVLQQQQGQWKLAGYYPKLAQIGAHDGDWFLARAREFKAKGQSHAAWFYYLTAWDLMAPLPFMGTAQLDKMVDEMQGVKPADLPSNSKPMPLMAGGKTFTLTELTPVPVMQDLYIRVRYQTPSVENTTQAYQDNMAVSKALVEKYPAFREAFAGVVARAVEPSGRDYVSPLAMKNMK